MEHLSFETFHQYKNVGTPFLHWARQVEYFPLEEPLELDIECSWRRKDVAEQFGKYVNALEQRLGQPLEECMWFSCHSNIPGVLKALFQPDPKEATAMKVTVPATELVVDTLIFDQGTIGCLVLWRAFGLRSPESGEVEWVYRTVTAKHSTGTSTLSRVAWNPLVKTPVVVFNKPENSKFYLPETNFAQTTAAMFDNMFYEPSIDHYTVAIDHDSCINRSFGELNDTKGRETRYDRNEPWVWVQRFRRFERQLIKALSHPVLDPESIPVQVQRLCNERKTQVKTA